MTEGCDEQEFERRLRYLLSQGFETFPDAGVLVRGDNRLSLTALRICDWDDITTTLFEQGLLDG